MLPEYRHHGTGAELLRHAIKTAGERGCIVMNLSIVEENTVLRKWYERYGAIHTGTEKFDFFPFTCGYMKIMLPGTKRMDFRIIEGADRIDTDAVVRLLKTTYWASKRSKEQIRKSMEHSSCYGIYLDDEQKLVGFARVISDFATTYYLADVIIDPEYRHRGLGKALVSHIVSLPEYSGLRGLLLTRDAHGLYQQFGFLRSECMVVLPFLFLYAFQFFVFLVGEALIVDIHFVGTLYGLRLTDDAPQVREFLKLKLVELHKAVIVEVFVLETVADHTLHIDTFQLLHHVRSVDGVHLRPLEGDDGAEIEELAEQLAVALRCASCL